MNGYLNDEIKIYLFNNYLHDVSQYTYFRSNTITTIQYQQMVFITFKQPNERTILRINLLKWKNNSSENQKEPIIIDQRLKS